MKITIEYEEKDEALDALNAGKILSALEEADNYLRGQLKHGDWEEKVCAAFEHARDLLRWQ